jgi:cyanophycin synthetase
MTGPWSATVVLSDSSVEVAVLETARGGIVRSGLGYDWSDISIMTNIQADHLGQDGIDTIDDILRIKRLVAERVRAGGTLILNADDEYLVHVPQEPKVSAIPKEIVYISLNPNNMVLNKHIAEGGVAYVGHGDWIEEWRPEAVSRIVRISSIPATFGGTAEFQIYNVLSTVAACRAYGVDAHRIAEALTAFRTERDGKGRANVYRMDGAYVIVDYGHNPAALRAVCQMVARWRSKRITAVVGVPGDRRDSLIEEAARAIGCGLSRIIVREDEDLRGRQPGEVAHLLARVLREEDPLLPLDVILDELDALAAALHNIEPRDVVIAFCDRLDAVTQWLLERGAQPVNELEIEIADPPAAAQPAA